MHIGADPLRVQRLHFGVQIFGGTGDTVGAEHPDDGGGRGADQSRQGDRGGPAGKAALAAAADQMHMLVDEAGGQDLTATVDNLAQPGQRADLQVLPDGDDLRTTQQYVPAPQGLWLIDVGIFKQGKHGLLSCVRHDDSATRRGSG
ncbi:hypothetical protein MAY91_13995 [Edwardsiella ictaluri]|uniref:Uncharacterized protein n=1 Tax=Edwardsiella ictaluri TaxID=67780 RepID=A0ABY8GES5_EDWIC|nr:hypothetical protein [Edwardsiella ictaluri]WFN95936.1 hypothetical protein MAY91_13995 [Edwardsiella ictaluri]